MKEVCIELGDEMTQSRSTSGYVKILWVHMRAEVGGRSWATVERAGRRRWEDE